MEKLEKCVKIGEKIGLSGGQLLIFIEKEEQKVHERDQRALERESTQKQYEFEEAERVRLHDIKLLVEEESKRHHELEMLNRKLELKEHDVSASWLPKCPKLPYFEEDKDDIDAYIRRFEVYAVSSKWETSHWATYLSSLLRGSALKVYTRMPSSDIGLQETEDITIETLSYD